ncbi:JAB domain-containing protein [Bacillus sp. S/N-304-OC-R1]|uniref:JAB domain-containing protein n=1 Tax=Bacillus sp. S/N-304-OC-R1 TaxID=2758034 RepID=UPI0028BD6655|nr:JAB domain-containing protein [Bacillus sp. S/N-304-OC-R1]
MQHAQSEETKKVRMRRLNVVKLQMLKEKNFPYITNVIRSPIDAVDLFREFIGKEDREHFVLLCLDTKNKITALNTVSIGSLNAAIVTPREIFKTAILANSCSLIVAHNHPSGCPIESREDIEISKRIKEAGKILGIKLLDHIIVGDNGKYSSLKEKGHI